MIPQDEYSPWPEDDDSAALAYLAEERQERSVAIIYDCVMRGLSEADARWLCSQCGVQWSDVCGFVQHALRREATEMTFELPF